MLLRPAYLVFRFVVRTTCEEPMDISVDDDVDPKTGSEKSIIDAKKTAANTFIELTPYILVDEFNDVFRRRSGKEHL